MNSIISIVIALEKKGVVIESKSAMPWSWSSSTQMLAPSKVLHAKTRHVREQKNENENGAQAGADQRSGRAAPVPTCAETGGHKQNRKKQKKRSGRRKKRQRTPKGTPQRNHPTSSEAINAVILRAFISLRSELRAKGRQEEATIQCLSPR